MANEKQEKKTPEIDVDAMVDNHVQKALKALEQFMDMTQEQVDKIVEAMTVAGQENHTRLAKMAVEETGRGVYEDKIIKNMFATEYIWHSIKNEKTVGIVEENELEGYVEIAEPVGVVAAATPVTNPTSTTMFKSLICMKSRNPVIFGFHPSAQQCSVEAAKVLYDAAVKAGAPENCIQWIETPSIQATTALMNHPGVSLILATGGAGMVRSAYSAGKPALGVGPGNVPCYIEKSAKLERACTDLMLSKTFDNGMICASEQAVIVDKELHKDFERIMKENNCYFLNAEETQKVSDYVINAQKQAVNPDVVGKSANWIAEHAGIKVPRKNERQSRIAKLPRAVGPGIPACSARSSALCRPTFVKRRGGRLSNASLEMLHMGGLGHSAVIHSTNDEIIKAFGEEMKVGRVIVNSPSSQGGIGDIYNSNTPSLTLGCGSYGHNSDDLHLLPPSTPSTKSASRQEEGQHAVAADPAEDLF
ncbi:MAG: aldehyde dehydrogenase family protein [Acutalibacteraceae bacterium]